MDMDMTSMLPGWWTPLAWIWFGVCLLSAAVLAYDIYGRGHRQQPRVMEPVWPISALFLGPVALLLYSRWARSHNSAAGTSRFARIVLALLPGAAASTVAHLIGVPVVFGAGWTIAGLSLWAVALFILVLATALLFVFEYAASAGVRQGQPAGQQAGRLLFGALITVLAFDVGMVGWMLYLHANTLMPPITDVVFTFQMQIGMLLGMFTASPIAAWLTAKDATASGGDASAAVGGDAELRHR